MLDPIGPQLALQRERTLDGRLGREPGRGPVADDASELLGSVVGDQVTGGRHPADRDRGLGGAEPLDVGVGDR